MLARYLLLSNRPVNASTMLAEVHKLMDWLHAKVYERCDPDLMVDLPLITKMVKPWTSFEFITKRVGASGPTKSECLSYYKE